MTICSEPVVSPSAERVLEQLYSLDRERLAFSSSDIRARSNVAQLMQDAGLAVEIDCAFNVIGRLAGSEDLAPLVVASHLDTVRQPGPFDGVLGVLSALECARVIASGARLKHPLLVIGFSDEEGSVSYGCWGARTVSGLLTDNEKEQLADRSSPLNHYLTRAARELSDLGWNVDPLLAPDCRLLRPAGYLELHIEQGPILEKRGIATGVVTAIVGINRYDVLMNGPSGHAGTVPMTDRDDPLVRTADLISSLWQAVLSYGPQAVANFGVIDVSPGSYNVIPQEVRLGVEIRSDQVAILAELDSFLRAEVALREGLVVDIGQDAPVALSREIRQIILGAASNCRITCQEMPSWAGHDAAVFAAQAPTGMIFVPSVGGASHCPQELTLQTDVQAGLDLLLATIRDADARLS